MSGGIRCLQHENHSRSGPRRARGSKKEVVAPFVEARSAAPPDVPPRRSSDGGVRPKEQRDPRLAKRTSPAGKQPALLLEATGLAEGQPEPAVTMAELGAQLLADDKRRPRSGRLGWDWLNRGLRDGSVVCLFTANYSKGQVEHLFTAERVRLYEGDLVFVQPSYLYTKKTARVRRLPLPEEWKSYLVS